MATPTSTTRNSRALRFGAIGVLSVLVALAAALIAAADSYASGKVDGVRAAVNHGTLNVTGSDGGQQVALRLKANDPSTIQVDAGDNGSADFSFASRAVDAIKVKLGDGNDSARIDDSNGAFTGNSGSRPTTIAGGGGNDSLEGGQTQVAAENETFKGGDGNDTVDGGKGNDTAYLGAGNDTFRWDNGEGSDVIEGQDGTDTMVFNGNSVATGEHVTMSANGGRLTFFRAEGNVTMDTNDVEIVDDNALGGTDTVLVNDLTGTDVTQTNVDLALTLGGNAPDGVVDTVTNATDGDDTIVSVAHADAIDQLNGPIQH
jgi:hemolysin type calcium-binding protein